MAADPEKALSDPFRERWDRHLSHMFLLLAWMITWCLAAALVFVVVFILRSCVWVLSLYA